MGQTGNEQPSQNNKLVVFAGWHRTESLWREIYARTVATLIAAAVAYFAAVFAGITPFNGLLVVIPFALMVVLTIVVRLSLRLIRYRQEFKRLGYPRLAVGYTVSAITLMSSAILGNLACLFFYYASRGVPQLLLTQSEASLFTVIAITALAVAMIAGAVGLISLIFLQRQLRRRIATRPDSEQSLLSGEERDAQQPDQLGFRTPSRTRSEEGTRDSKQP